MLLKTTMAVLCIFPMMAVAEIQPGDPALTGDTIEVKQDQMQSGYKGELRQMTLTIIDAEGRTSKRALSFEGLEEPDRHDKSIIRFQSPADIRDTALLTHEHGADDDDQWLYLPSLKRVKRIASSNKSGSFMGSEFAYEDLVVRQLDKYTFRYLGDEVVNGVDCYVLERIPKSDNSGYSKTIRWRMKSNLQELKTAYYDRKGDLLKERLMEGHRLIDGFWRVSTITVRNVQTKKASVLTFDKVKLKVNLPESRFTVQQMEQT